MYVFQLQGCKGNVYCSEKNYRTRTNSLLAVMGGAQ